MITLVIVGKRSETISPLLSEQQVERERERPERLPLELPRLDLAAIGQLDFETPDRKRFPCLDLAFEALRGNEAAPAVLNAANEVTVAAFLEERIGFQTIAAVNGAVLETHFARSGDGALRDLDDVAEADAWARNCARERLDGATEGSA